MKTGIAGNEGKGRKTMKKYSVKCDDCKKTIRETDDVQESYCGGRCAGCKASKFKVGSKIESSGFKGTITSVCTGQLKGMYEIHLPGGYACVSGSDLKAV